jgi:hypothetical protein
MAACTKCGTELIGGGKFCATCGAPIEAAAVIVTPMASEGPTSQVNPFASTASPSHSIGDRKSAPPVAPSRPPPAEGASPVSPLAISNTAAERGAFEKAIESAMGKASSPPAPSAKKPGTQLMDNAPKHPRKADAPTADASTKKKAPAARTVAMGFQAGAPPWSKPARESDPKPQSMLGQPSSRSSQPSKSTQGTPQSIAVGAPPTQPPPQSVLGQPQSMVGQPQSVLGQLQSGQAYSGQGPYGQAYGHPGTPASAWSRQQQQPPVYAASHAFAYAPGMRVQVTWSNGQRYPATVSQLSGAQCLVVFPDGQQHWVETQYISPS